MKKSNFRKLVLNLILVSLVSMVGITNQSFADVLGDIGAFFSTHQQMGSVYYDSMEEVFVISTPVTGVGGMPQTHFGKGKTLKDALFNVDPLTHREGFDDDWDHLESGPDNESILSKYLKDYGYQFHLAPKSPPKGAEVTQLEAKAKDEGKSTDESKDAEDSKSSEGNDAKPKKKNKKSKASQPLNANNASDQPNSEQSNSEQAASSAAEPVQEKWVQLEPAKEPAKEFWVQLSVQNDGEFEVEVDGPNFKEVFEKLKKNNEFKEDLKPREADAIKLASYARKLSGSSSSSSTSPDCMDKKALLMKVVQRTATDAFNAVKLYTYMVKNKFAK